MRSSAIFFVRVVTRTRPPRRPTPCGCAPGGRRSARWWAAPPPRGRRGPVGPDDLVHHLARHLELVGARSGRQEDDLAHRVAELVEGERAVVERRREAEPVLHERVLARPVALVLPVDLGDRHVALVDDGQEVGREEVEQRVGGLPRGSPVEMAAVVLDAVAHPDLGEHLEVVLGPHPEPLGLEQLARRLQLGQALAELGLDRRDGASHGLVAGHVVGGREHHELLDVLPGVAGRARRSGGCARPRRRTARCAPPAPRRRGAAPRCRPARGNCPRVSTASLRS